jgi:hypothetical protein
MVDSIAALTGGASRGARMFKIKPLSNRPLAGIVLALDWQDNVVLVLLKLEHQMHVIEFVGDAKIDGGTGT